MSHEWQGLAGLSPSRSHSSPGSQLRCPGESWSLWRLLAVAALSPQSIKATLITRSNICPQLQRRLRTAGHFCDVSCTLPSPTAPSPAWIVEYVAVLGRHISKMPEQTFFPRENKWCNWMSNSHPTSIYCRWQTSPLVAGIPVAFTSSLWPINTYRHLCSLAWWLCLCQSCFFVFSLLSHLLLCKGCVHQAQHLLEIWALCAFPLFPSALSSHQVFCILFPISF